MIQQPSTQRILVVSPSADAARALAKKLELTKLEYIDIRFAESLRGLRDAEIYVIEGWDESRRFSYGEYYSIRKIGRAHV